MIHSDKNDDENSPIEHFSLFHSHSYQKLGSVFLLPNRQNCSPSRPVMNHNCSVLSLDIFSDACYLPMIGQVTTNLERAWRKKGPASLFCLLSPSFVLLAHHSGELLLTYSRVFVRFYSFVVLILYPYRQPFEDEQA